MAVENEQKILGLTFRNKTEPIEEMPRGWCINGLHKKYSIL
jgi:hypothetical protein